MKDRHIGVIMGGTSQEAQVSLASGNAVATALETANYRVSRIALGHSVNALQQIAAADIDVAFVALHGRYGEDGCIQGMLELLQIPYTGSGLLASALAMDKLKAKELFRLHNLRTPPYYVVSADRQNDLEELHGAFGFPVIAKPRQEGSSFGVSRANNLSELSRAVQHALDFDADVLVERFIQGKEIAVAVLDERVLGAIEVAPKSGIYDHSAKYTPGLTDYHLPARLSATRLRGVLNLGELAARALGTKGAARVDLLVTESENEYVLEVNTLPGMTPTSLLPKIAAAAGFNFLELCEAILERASLNVGRPAHIDSELMARVSALSAVAEVELDGPSVEAPALAHVDRGVARAQRVRSA